jgi:hypothetical protein
MVLSEEQTQQAITKIQAERKYNNLLTNTARNYVATLKLVVRILPNTGLLSKVLNDNDKKLMEIFKHKVNADLSGERLPTVDMFKKAVSILGGNDKEKLPLTAAERIHAIYEQVMEEKEQHG